MASVAGGFTPPATGVLAEGVLGAVCGHGMILGRGATVIRVERGRMGLCYTFRGVSGVG